jgi:hypothetical protein
MKTIFTKEGNPVIVDDDDFDRLSAFKWHTIKNGYAAVYMKEIQRRALMHRVIMGVEQKRGFFVDHVNGNRLDNRKENLRVATSQQNNRNRRVCRNKHGVKGVGYWPTSTNKGVKYPRARPWCSYIKFNGKFIGLGYYKTAEEAASAYDAAAKKYFGEFAATNRELGLTPIAAESPLQAVER